SCISEFAEVLAMLVIGDVLVDKEVLVYPGFAEEKDIGDIKMLLPSGESRIRKRISLLGIQDALAVSSPTCSQMSEHMVMSDESVRLLSSDFSRLISIYKDTE
ncbi:hypothetical protein Tco_0611139, partial [Tanacetum coccineum]